MKEQTQKYKPDGIITSQAYILSLRAIINQFL